MEYRVTRPAPPRPAVWLVGCLLPPAQRESLIGDLVEERTLRSSAQPGASDSSWYWRQVARSLLPLVWAAMLRRRWLGAAGAAIAGYGLFKVLELVGGAAVSRLIAPGSSAGGTVGILFGLFALALGGYVAARMRRGAAAGVALISALSVTEFLVTAEFPVPLWYAGALLVTCPGAALAGGALRLERRG
jgi:hypothetical protein